MKLIGFLFGLFVICAAIFSAVFVPAAWFSEPTSGAPNLSIDITASSTAATVADQLVEKGVLTTTMGYRLYAMIDASANKPRAGSYTVQPGMSYRVIAKKIAAGPQRDEVSVKVIEGWSLMDEANMLKDMGVTLQKPLASDYESDYPFLADLPKGVTLEGYLFPDTYRVWKDQLPEGLVKKQLDAFASRADRIETEAKKQGRTVEEVVTLASIVQKEVADKSEMKTVAGIFWNRLKIGMPLQSDATVNYITHAGNTRPSAKELKSESPYNTYLNKGLPPGPISNPGADALEAALFPEKSSYLYFLTDANGKLYLAKTLDEHIRNRNKAFGE